MQSSLPVAVISVNAVDGNIRPIRFHGENPGQQIIRGDIERILDVNELCYVGVHMFSYLCSAQMNGKRRVLELRYLVREHRWVLFRVVN